MLPCFFIVLVTCIFYKHLQAHGSQTIGVVIRFEKALKICISSVLSILLLRLLFIINKPKAFAAAAGVCASEEKWKDYI